MPRALFLLLALATFVAGPWASVGFAQGIDLDLLPADISVSIGQQFDIELTVPVSSDEFNAFELTVEYDDSALKLISNQEGPLMTAACGNRFHVFGDPGGVFNVTDALLCPGARASGPGVIYRLTFKAEPVNTISTVILRFIGFSNGGVAVTPISASNAIVRIGDVTGLPEDPDGVPAARLHVPYPNPFTRAVHLGFSVAAEIPARLEIYSVDGRRVRTFFGDGSSRGTSLSWNGTDDRGRALPPGVYLVRLVAGDQAWSRRVVKVK